MQYLNELSVKDALKVILSKKELSEKFYGQIHQSEMEDYLNDKLSCFDRSCVDYEIGVYNPNHFRIRDEYDQRNLFSFLEGVEQSIRCFGSSEKLEKLTAQCRKLAYSNLFEHKVKGLCSLYYEEELEPIVDFVEKCSYDIYSKDEDSNNLLDYVDFFVENYGDEYYMEDGEVYHVARRIS